MSKSIFDESKRVWESNLKLFPESKLQFPDEHLIRLISGRYVDVPKAPAKVMDHGFGHGNTLIYLASQGYHCAGCEISELLIDEVNHLFDQEKKSVDLRQITSGDIPFEDHEFDLVISWNVVHYNGTKSDVQHCINELYRVLKPGGILLLSTISKESSVFDRMDSIGNGTHQINRESIYDNRTGLKFFVADDIDSLEKMFDQFSETKQGQLYFDLFNSEKRHAANLIYARK